MSPPGRNYAQSQPMVDAMDRYRNMRASFEHLLDLKKANYSPTMTEMRIKRGSDVIVVSRPMNHSPTGSSGALCESGTSCIRAFHGARIGRS